MNYGGGGDGGGYTNSRSLFYRDCHRHRTATERAPRVFRTEITDAALFALARNSDVVMDQKFWIEKTHNVFDESLKSY